jgi:predicted transcriptional regulator
MTNDQIQINIRLPADLKERLEQAASENKRSTTAEIAARLDASFDPAGASGDTLAQTVADKVVETLDAREKRRKKA